MNDPSPPAKRLRGSPSAAAAYIQQWYNTKVEQKREKQAKTRIVSLADSLAHTNNRQDNLLDRGDAVLADFLQCLDAFPGLFRSSGQQRFHSEMLTTLLPYIYGDAFTFNSRSILLKLGLGGKDIFREIMVVSQRRMGKTKGMAIFCAAALLTVPKIEIAVFGSTRTVSRKFIKLTEDLIKTHSTRSKNLRTPTNADRITVYGSDKIDERIATAYAGELKVRVLMPRVEILSIYLLLLLGPAELLE